ncbi:hypothetical protein [Phytoactinopolyspora limicola]|uniref:hypothetical protein n=1 Tax=Phytoactinopolyspora limicola TaxID=2715536 RepID=UPI00140D1D94|nr:hypothetical protein [Phytoactinopolyspora limicola]
MSDRPNWRLLDDGSALIPGRYGHPGVRLESSQINEIKISVVDMTRTAAIVWVNQDDLYEAVVAVHPDEPDKAELWDEGFEAGATWRPSGPSGVPNDPPANPYRRAVEPSSATPTDLQVAPGLGDEPVGMTDDHLAHIKWRIVALELLKEVNGLRDEVEAQRRSLRRALNGGGQ